ncbi:MAG: hypothetical protein AMXMBFR53_14540 [Gemmatimonadota bacterium]
MRHAEARRGTLEALSRRDAALMRLQALLGLNGALPGLAAELPDLALLLDVDAAVFRAGVRIPTARLRWPRLPRASTVCGQDRVCWSRG